MADAILVKKEKWTRNMRKTKKFKKNESDFPLNNI